jgi:hypothetical protein
MKGNASVSSIIQGKSFDSGLIGTTVVLLGTEAVAI